MPPVTVDSSVRRRNVWDTVSITATSIGKFALFQSSAGKSDIQMRPKLQGEMPAGQRFNCDGMMLALPSGYTMDADAQALDGSFLSLIVQDQLGESKKLRGLTRTFPAGGGVDGLIALGDDGVTVEPISNGLATVAAIYRFDPAVLVEPKIAFRVDLDIPVALTGLTTGSWVVVLTGLWEFFLA